MSQRERLLAILAGGLLAFAVVLGGGQKINGMFRVRKDRIASLNEDIRLATRRIQRGAEAADDMLRWEQQSLSGDPEQASSSYKSWVTDWVERHGVLDPKVKVDSPRTKRSYEREYYTIHPFTISGGMDLRQLTRMLYDFYGAGQLHRIRGLTISPVGAKRLDVYLTIDALSLPDAPDRQRIDADPRQLAELGEIAGYEQPIFERNLFGPENNAPRLSLRSSYQASQGERFTLDAEASDRDEVDKLTYNADLEELPDARFRDGKLEWVPRELGEYYAVIEVQDDGIPARMDRKEIRLTVVEPPEPPAPPPRPKFDFAAFTQFNAVIVKNDVPTAWLWVRPTDEMLKVKPGDSFRIGDMQGRMVEVGLDWAEFVRDGRRYRMDLRGFVGKARDIGAAESPTAATDDGGEAPQSGAGESDESAASHGELLPPVEVWEADDTASQQPPAEEAAAEEAAAEEPPAEEAAAETH